MEQHRLSYQGDMEDGSSVYHMFLADRVVFEARVDKAETGLPIYIRPVHIPDTTWIKTSCRAFLVEDKSRISADSMKVSIFGNLPFLLADLLVGPVQK